MPMLSVDELLIKLTNLAVTLYTGIQLIAELSILRFSLIWSLTSLMDLYLSLCLIARNAD